MGAQNPRPNFSILKFLPSPAKKKSIISQKLRIAQKKSFMQILSVRLIPIYPANLTVFEIQVEFLAAKTPLLNARSAQTRYDVSTLRIFYVKMAISERGVEGLHILRWEIT